MLEGNSGSTATNANQETWSWSGNQPHLDLGHGCEEVQKYSPVRYLCNTTSPMQSTEESRWTRHRRAGSAGRCQICKGIWGHGCDHTACNPPQLQSCPQLCQGQRFLSLSLAPVGKRGNIRPIWLSYGRSPGMRMLQKHVPTASKQSSQCRRQSTTQLISIARTHCLFNQRPWLIKEGSSPPPPAPTLK